jgi:hypothetical protein
VAAAWLLAVSWAPVQAAGPSRSFGVDLSLQGSTCRHFATGRIVGAGFGATVGMRVEVCWNGREAFVVGDPGVPLPAGIMAPTDDPLLTACGLDDREDFATVSGTTCTARIDDDGTLHYSVRSRVSPLPLPIGAREVRMDLVVTGSGVVLQEP